MVRSVLRGHRIAAAIAVLLSIFGALLTAWQPLLLQQVVDSLGTGRPINRLVALMVLAAIVQAVVTGYQIILLTKIGERWVYSVRNQLSRHLLSTRLDELDRRPVGDLVSRITTDSGLLRAFVRTTLAQTLSAILIVIFASVMMLRSDSVMFLITVTVFGFSLVVVSQLGRAMNKAALASQTATGELASISSQTLSTMRLIRSSGAEVDQLRKIKSCTVAVRNSGLKIGKLSAAAQPTMAFSSQVVFVAVLLTGAVRVTDGAMTLGALIGFLLYLFLLSGPLSTLVQGYTEWQMARAAWRRIEEVFEFETEAQLPAPGYDPCSQPNQSLALSVEFENVCFAYSEGAPVLRGVTFSAPAGSFVGIVGETGSGKSTLLSIMEGFYSHDSGVVKIDGVNLSDRNISELRERVAYIEQDSPVLAGSIGENLTLGRRVDDTEIASVLTDIRLDSMVSRHDLGVRATLGDGGIRLSGGQRQRLAWGRAILRKPGLVLMDEPTANLDALTEGELMSAMRGHFSHATRIVVSHRLATVLDADLIVVLREGVVAGCGTHNDLLNSNQYYRDLATAQKLSAQLPV
ncbi:ABC transporter ATP-binding protein [Rhodococcus erythropolis]|nr:ABC transporter ATP-binding protein [Rhodococcus erythropolis]